VSVAIRIANRIVPGSSARRPFCESCRNNGQVEIDDGMAPCPHCELGERLEHVVWEGQFWKAGDPRLEQIRAWPGTAARPAASEEQARAAKKILESLILGEPRKKEKAPVGDAAVTGSADSYHGDPVPAPPPPTFDLDV
jgi:hypothetical protein